MRAGVMQAHAIHVLTPGEDGITAITVFLEPALFRGVRDADEPMSDRQRRNTTHRIALYM